MDDYDFWEDVGLTCGGYNSDIDEDLINVFIQTSINNWYSEIAKTLGLDEKYVIILLEILCAADFCEYGTSPRGAWAIQDTFESNLKKLTVWYEHKWNEEFKAKKL
jgi:hypothetical protein